MVRITTAEYEHTFKWTNTFKDETLFFFRKILSPYLVAEV